MSASETLRDNRADSLIRRSPHQASTTAGLAGRQFEGRTKLNSACVIAIDRLIPDPDQPRKTFAAESMERLVASMRERGQLVPALVRWDAESSIYVVVDGERRFRAAITAGLSSLVCLVIDQADPDEVLEVQLITNALRDEVLPVEQARVYKRLIERRGCTHRELAESLDIAHATVTKALGLLDLNPDLQQRVDEGTLKPSTAYEIAKVDADLQVEIVAKVNAEKLGRDEVAEVVRQVKARQPKPAKGRGGKPKPKPLPTEHTFKAADGRKVIVSGRKGFQRIEALESLREVVRALEEELGGDEAREVA